MCRSTFAPFFAAAAVALLPGHSVADGFEGRYLAGSKKYQQGLVVTKGAAGRFTVAADVGTRGCAGEVKAEGVAKDNVLTASVMDQGETCTLTLTRAGKGLRVEEDHCLPYHGAACDFSGDYRKR